MTSSGNPSARATSNATATPPRGSPSTIESSGKIAVGELCAQQPARFGAIAKRKFAASLWTRCNCGAVVGAAMVYGATPRIDSSSI